LEGSPRKRISFWKNVVNYKKIQPGTKTIWFYTDKDKLYLWGHGNVTDITTTQNEDFVATFTDFTFYDNVSGLELEQSTQNKIKSLESWNPYNSIIEIGKETYNEILKNILQLETFDDKPLSSFSDDQINEGYEKISEILLIPKEKVIEILIALISGRHVLLAGPIGTGKTRLASLIPEIFWHNRIGGGEKGYLAEIHTATADWSTQDVIGGIMPMMKDENIVYEFQYGCALDTIQKNWEYGIDGGKRIKTNSYKGIWLVIDEFNRADIDKAFGQLFTALRTRSLKIPISNGNSSFRDIKIPGDYRIICTLNTADKHFLFRLSDALKSRFAYIEIYIPGKDKQNQEIYYAMKNAVEEIRLDDVKSIIDFDHENKIIIKETTNEDIYKRIYQAYTFLDFVRLFKKLGTAILQLIYQTILIGNQITKDTKQALDNALTSTLIPQLESFSEVEIGTIAAMCDDRLVEFFQDKNTSPYRQSYSKPFSLVLEYLNVEKYEELKSKFEKGNLNAEDIQKEISPAYERSKDNFEMDLISFRDAVNDLTKLALT
jgi:MoxR-like ATPase